MAIITITFILAAIAVIILLLVKWNFSYWKRYGLEYVKPNFFESPGVKIFNAYLNFKKKGVKHGGAFLLFKPIYIPVDLDIVKNILSADFTHFVNRGFFENPEPILNHIVNMVDDEWKHMRAKLSPTFTTGKMKMMFQTFCEKTTDLVDVLDEQAIINEPTNIKEILSRFTTDIIGSTIFGIECNSLRTPDCQFRNFGNDVTNRVQTFITYSAVPSIFFKIFKIKVIPQQTESYFLKVIDSTIKYRETNNIYCKDFMQLLLQIKHQGKISDKDDGRTSYKNNSEGQLTLMQIAAQSLLFFAAGYETSSTAMTFAMLELAQNQEIQDKLRNEIRNVLVEYDGKLNYDAIMKMEYLDKVVQETLRINPPAPLFTRLCSKDYPVPGTNYTIKKGQLVMLPYRAVHRNPEHWPEPEKFDPERFSPENKAKRHRYAFLAFGEGPRMCIGARFGMLQAKAGIASVINKFKVTLSDKTTRPIEINYDGFLSSTKNVLWVNLEKAD